MTKRLLSILAAASALWGCMADAVAQQSPWPDGRPLTLVVPFPAGGTSDAIGRMVATELERALGRAVKVENIPGAGGATGTLNALARPADGYTLIQSGIGQSAVAQALNHSLGYDSTKDLIHLTQVHEGANVLVVKPDSPHQSAKALIDAASGSTAGVVYGHTPASSGHMAMELLIQTLSVCVTAPNGGLACKSPKFRGTPFSGGKPLLDAVMKGDVATAFINLDAVLRPIKEGKLKPIAVSSIARSPLLPDVPTLSEAGFAGFAAVSWSGISVDKRTPPAVVSRLEAELVKVMKSPAVKQRMEADGFTVPTLGSEAYSAYVAKEVGRWTRVVRVAGIKAP